MCDSCAILSQISVIEAEAVEGINMTDMEIKDVEELIDKYTKECSAEFAVNSAMKTIHQNDPDVFQFILVCTKCDHARATSVEQMQWYQTEHGGHVFSRSRMSR